MALQISINSTTSTRLSPPSYLATNDCGRQTSDPAPRTALACGDGSKVLEFIEEALDEVTFAIKREITSPRRLAIGFWRNHRGDPSLSESVDQRISVISLITKQGIRIGAVDQLLRTSPIVGLS